MTTEPIPFVDLKAQYQRLKPEIDKNINTVLDHGRFIMGPEVSELENTLKDFCAAEHVVGVGNGTDAIQIALMGEGIGPGDAVFVPSFTFTATAEAILLCGAEPVFCETDPESFTIETNDLTRKITATKNAGRLIPKAVISVDLFGLPADYNALNAICDDHDLSLIADAAQAMGGKFDDRPIGSLATVTTTSFFPAKPLGCYGDGGALLTNDEDRANIYRSIRAHGSGGAKYDIARIGTNSRLDTLQAAILLAKLPVFEEEIGLRTDVANRYDDGLAGIVKTPARFSGRASAWAQYGILTERRDGLAEHLKQNGIPTAIYYPLPMHLQTAYRKYGDGPGSLPVSEQLSKSILNLPIHPYLDRPTSDRIIDCIKNFFNAKDI
jgi:dTDP-4-amino-4,6-dideoxygalactose transaminase